MARQLSSPVKEQLSGEYGIIPLIRFEIPGLDVGYYYGPRPFNWNGFTYKPNSISDVEDLVETLDTLDEERVVKLNGMTDKAGELPAAIRGYSYVGAFSTVSRVIVDPATSIVIGPAETSFYEIFDLRIKEDPEGSHMLVSVEVVLRSLGYTGRRKTSVMRSTIMHQENFNPKSTFYDNIDQAKTIKRQWGTRNG